MELQKPVCTSKTSQTDILAFLKQVAIKELELSEAQIAQIGLETPIVEGLQLDSVAQVVLITALEDKYDFVFDPDELEGVETIQDLLSITQKQTQQRTSGTQ